MLAELVAHSKPERDRLKGMEGNASPITGAWLPPAWNTMTGFRPLD
jgi:hypothetical protein